MPRCCSPSPRKNLPPPITTATWAPVVTTSAIWRATVSTTPGSTPTDPPPNISPPSLSSTRRYPALGPSESFRGVVIASPSSVAGSGLADLEAGELADGDTCLVEQRLHRLLRLVDRRLPQQHDVLEEAVDPALDDARQHLLGLALLASGGLGDAALVLQHLARDLVAGGVLRPSRCDVHGHALGGVVAPTLVRDQRADGRRQV